MNKSRDKAKWENILIGIIVIIKRFIGCKMMRIIIDSLGQRYRHPSSHFLRSTYLLIISVMANISYQMIKTHLPNMSLSN